MVDLPIPNSSFCPQLRSAKIVALNRWQMFRARPPERSSLSWSALACWKKCRAASKD